MNVCLGIPGRVIELSGDVALVDFLGIRREVDASMAEGIGPGDYVVVHAGVIISKLDPEEAERTLDAWREMVEFLSSEGGDGGDG